MWKQGPVPEDAHGYGGVVLACPVCRGDGVDPHRSNHGGDAPPPCPACKGGGSEGGFRFAEFTAGGVVTVPDVGERPRRVRWYSTALKLPPGEDRRIT